VYKLWSEFITNVDKNFAEVIIWDIVKVIVFFAIAKLIIRLSKRIIRRIFLLQSTRIDKRRSDTLESLVENIVRYTVYFLFIVEALSTFHVNIAALLAGAGVAGLAVGFGAQSLIKDFLTGFFILFEDQYGVGDMVQINDFTGVVIQIGVRLTRVQAWTGEIEVIPNGQITTVRNYSKANSMAVIDMGVSYGTNLGDAIRIMERVMQELKEEDDNIVGEVSVSGVQALRDYDVLIRATAECAPTTHFSVQRKAQRLIKEAFDEAGLKPPFLQKTTQFVERHQLMDGGSADGS
jgi:moderate conductance mechanosensitive channel